MDNPLRFLRNNLGSNIKSLLYVNRTRTGVLPYYVVYVRTYTEASASWIAILFAVLPFIAFFTNPILCSLADKSSSHLKYLLLFTALTGFGYGSLLILPTIQSSLFSWLISLVLLLIAYPSMATVTSLTDSIVMMMVTPDEPDCTESVKKPQFGQIRVWGTIGYGLFGFLSGPINSVNFGPSYLEMGFIMFIVILILDLTIVSVCARKWSILVMPSATGQTRIKGQNERKEEEEETNEKFISRKEQQETLNCQKNSQQHWSIFVSLFIHHPTLIQHTIILIGQGVLMACHWSYFYWFLELVSGRNTFLMGLTLLIGCFCGELIFFYYGNSIVNQIGSTNAFNISLAAFAVQYTIYAFLITPENQYLVCLTEVLQGPTFGLFYTAMTHIGQEYADKQAAILQSSKSESAANVTQIHATLQGFLSGCLEGLGLGLGSLGAGLLIDRYGVHIMWMIAASLAVFMLIFNSSFQLIRAIMIKRKS